MTSLTNTSTSDNSPSYSSSPLDRLRNHWKELDRLKDECAMLESVFAEKCQETNNCRDELARVRSELAEKTKVLIDKEEKCEAISREKLDLEEKEKQTRELGEASKIEISNLQKTIAVLEVEKINEQKETVYLRELIRRDDQAITRLHQNVGDMGSVLKEAVLAVRKERMEGKSAQDKLTQELSIERTRAETMKTELEDLKKSKEENEEQFLIVERQLKRRLSEQSDTIKLQKRRINDLEQEVDIMTGRVMQVNSTPPSSTPNSSRTSNRTSTRFNP